MTRYSIGKDENMWSRELLPWDIRAKKLLLSFAIKNKKPTEEQLNKILDFLEKNGIKKGSLITVSGFSKWIVGDIADENFLLKKFTEGSSEAQSLIATIHSDEPVLFLGITVNKILNHKNDRSPVFKKGKRRRRIKNIEWCFMFNVLTNNSQIASFLLPFYDLAEDSEDMIKNMFTLFTTNS